MLGFYNTNFNNTYINQNYGYQSLMNPYQQQSSLFGGYQTGLQQQPAFEISSVFTQLISSLFNQQSFAFSCVNINRNNQSSQNSFTSLLGVNQHTSTDNTSNNSLVDLLKSLIISSSSPKTPISIDSTTAIDTPNIDKLCDEEKSLIKGLDLSAVTKDGQPRYVLTKCPDGKYHLFDRGENQQNDHKGYYTWLAVSDDAKKWACNTKEKQVQRSCSSDTTIVDEKNSSFVYSSPLTFDLNGDGVKTSNKLIQYDIDGDGKTEKINDVTDGTLSIRGGKDGKDLFGDNTDLDGDGKADGFKNGFDALKALALKEGLINNKNDMKLDAKDIKILEDKYKFGMKTDGYNSKEKSLASLGITEINLGKTDKTQSTENFDGQGNLLMKQDGASFKINGKSREYADVWHTTK